MKPGRIIILGLGTLCALIGLGLLGGAGVAGWANYQQRDGGFYTSRVEYVSHNSHAVTSPGLDLTAAQSGPAPAPGDIPASVLLRGRAVDPAKEIFIGIAPRPAVAAYLTGVKHAEIAEVRFDPFLVRYRESAGSTVPAPPAGQKIWVASATGPGLQELRWDLTSGDWAAVVMNADAGSPVAVELQAGARSELLWPLFLGLLIGGLVFLALGVPLILAGAAGLGRAGPLSNPPPAKAIPAYGAPASPAGTVPTYPAPHGTPPAADGPAYPARLSGYLDPDLSRWLWLVKWFLAIPHYIVLAFLWFAFVVTTIAAWFAILFTGRYPRSLFNFNVGVIRWSWRVAFYAYAVLGTDRYPPFTLARTDYPADFDVDYPERLSRGLVLVKSWLLAIPHLLIIALLTGSVRAGGAVRDGVWVQEGIGVSLLGLLVFIAGVILLVTGEYRRSLFDLLLGLNRWIYRVMSYVALLRDEYPPFRLDPGPADPADVPPAVSGGLPPASAGTAPPGSIGPPGAGPAA